MNRRMFAPLGLCLVAALTMQTDAVATDVLVYTGNNGYGAYTQLTAALNAVGKTTLVTTNFPNDLSEFCSVYLAVNQAPFSNAQINLRQRRLLAYAYCHGKTFSTTEYERITEVDRDTAYRDIRAMVKNGIVAPLKPKSRSYHIIERL